MKIMMAKSKMKVAVFYSGTIRTYQQNFESFSNSFLTTPGVEVDVYASTNKNNLNDILQFSRLYNPKKMRILHYDSSTIPEEYSFINREENWNNYNTLSMYFHNKTAMEVISSGNIIYDLVVHSSI